MCNPKKYNVEIAQLENIMYKNLEPSRKNIVYLAGRREKLPNTIYPDKTLLIYASHLLFQGLRYRDMGKEGNIFYFFYFIFLQYESLRLFIFIAIAQRVLGGIVERTRVHTEWQLPISGVHFIMMEKSALAGEGGGCTPIPFHSIYHHEQSCRCSVCSS
jgi:hypothetical protein